KSPVRGRRSRRSWQPARHLTPPAGAVSEGRREPWPWPVVAHSRHGAKRLLLVVAEHARDHDVVAAGADGVVITEARGADQRLADMHQLAVPPHLFRGSAAARPCA